MHLRITFISSRSLLTEYNICSDWARSNFSGGIDGTPRARSPPGQMSAVKQVPNCSTTVSKVCFSF